MAEQSKALPLTASCLSPLPGYASRAGACEKVASDFALGGGFHRVTMSSRFLHYLQLASHYLAAIW